jgi:hypothetical protein
MRLTYNVIINGRYFKAGEDIPDDLISDAVRKYAVTDADDDEMSAPIEPERSKVKPPKLKASFVKREEKFVCASNVNLNLRRG